MPTFTKLPLPIVGQEYVSTRSDHIGRRVLVKHVSEQSVQAEGISPHHGEHYNYHIDQFLRDFEPVTPTPAILPSLPEPTSKLCPSCNTIKALTEFRLLPSRRGGLSTKRMNICSACNGLRIGKALRASTANKASKPNKATPTAATLPALSGKHLSEVLYDLAIKIAPLVSPDTLTVLHDAVDDFLKTGVAAQGVYVFPADAVTKLTKANVRPQQ